MKQQVLENIWKLRTDPFYPEVDANGQTLQKKALDRSLNPLIDKRAVSYYYDIYDWTASDLVRDLCEREVLRIFPTTRTLPRNLPLMIILSGSMGTGLDSLANLIVHKINLTSDEPPIVVDVQLQGRKKPDNVSYVGRKIAMKMRLDKTLALDSLAESMETEYQRVSKELSGKDDATYAELFEAYSDLLEPIGRKLVIKITEGGDNDNWVQVYESTKKCCSFIIVMTSEVPFAKTCYEAMLASNLNVAWIRVVPLNLANATSFLTKRLASERLTTSPPQQNDSFLPFSAGAIDALYERGTTSLSNDKISHSMGWLRRTLSQAFTDKLDSVAQACSQVPASALDNIDPATTRISANDMRAAREKLNRGR